MRRLIASIFCSALAVSSVSASDKTYEDLIQLNRKYDGYSDYDHMMVGSFVFMQFKQLPTYSLGYTDAGMSCYTQLQSKYGFSDWASFLTLFSADGMVRAHHVNCIMDLGYVLKTASERAQALKELEVHFQQFHKQ